MNETTIPSTKKEREYCVLHITRDWTVTCLTQMEPSNWQTLSVQTG